MNNQWLLYSAGAFVLYVLYQSGKDNTNPSTPTTGIDNTPPGIGQDQRNQIAFLKTIQYGEGTYNRPNPYAVTYAYSHTIQNFTDHPAITGEWLGEILPDRFCVNAGITPPCRSTAAGAYQIIKRTWEGIKGRYNGLSFDQYGQDTGALDLINRRGALNDVLAGRFEIAVSKVSNVWASFPGNTFGQGGKDYTDLLQFYRSVGGQLENEFV